MNATPSVRTRWAAIGAAVAVTLGAAGLGGYNLVSADVSAGDRPVFIPITPCRLTDTRPAPNTVGPRSTALSPDETVTVTAHGSNGECVDASSIPNDATALALNVTALNATSQTFLTFWGGGANPGTANLNPAPGQPPTPNAVNTPLSDAGTFDLYNERGSVDVVIDVNGYYAPHDHDDRYYTKSDIDDRFALAVDNTINVNVFGFKSSLAGSKWGQELTLAHFASAGRECASSTLELPPGRTIEQVSIGYLNTAVDDTMEVGLRLARNLRGSYTVESEIVASPLALVEQSMPVTGPTFIGTTTFAADAAVAQTEEGSSYVMTLCTQMEVFIINVSVELAPL